MKDRNEGRREAPDDQEAQFADTRPMRPIRDAAPASRPETAARQASRQAADQFADTRPIRPVSGERRAFEDSGSTGEDGDDQLPAGRAPKNIVEQFGEIAAQYDDTRPMRPVVAGEPAQAAPEAEEEALPLDDDDEDLRALDDDEAELIPQAVLDAMADLEANEPEPAQPEPAVEPPDEAGAMGGLEVAPVEEDGELDEEPFVPLDLEWDGLEEASSEAGPVLVEEAPEQELTPEQELAPEPESAGEDAESLEDTGPLPELSAPGDTPADTFVASQEEAEREIDPGSPEQFSDTRPLPPIGAAWLAERESDDEAE